MKWFGGWGKVVGKTVKEKCINPFGIWWAWVIKPTTSRFSNFYEFQCFLFSYFHKFQVVFLLHARNWPTYQAFYSMNIISLHFTCFHLCVCVCFQLCLATPLSIIFANMKLIKWWPKEEKETKKAIFDVRRREIVSAMVFLSHLV